MARIAIPLTDTKIKNLSFTGKNKKYYDGNGLFILHTAQSKLWRVKYRYNNKEKSYSIGSYPDISLKRAREIAQELKEQVRHGIDPSEAKKSGKIISKIQAQEDTNTFKYVADQYLDTRQLNEKYIEGIRSAFKRYVYDHIGSTPVNKVLPRNIIEILKKMEKDGILVSAHRMFTQVNKVFKYAVSNQLAAQNPCVSIDKNEVIAKPEKKHFATITDPKTIGMMLNIIDDYTGDYTTRMALSIMPYVFLRPYNIRYAQWSEIDFEKMLWTIPGKKMKTKHDHLIPLTQTTANILKEAKRYTADAVYIFPSTRSKTSPMSDNTLNNALRRMGYTKEEITAHGFRAMFSTIAHEEGKSHEVIETQLAHSVGTQVSQAYNRAKYLNERKEIMQWWSDWLDAEKQKIS